MGRTQSWGIALCALGLLAATACSDDYYTRNTNPRTFSQTFVAPGIDRFIRLAELCFRRDATRYPTGQLAITAGGEVVSAPSIQNPSFERDQISVTGNFDRDEADQLAEAFQP